jgi:hypothetical protein
MKGDSSSHSSVTQKNGTPALRSRPSASSAAKLYNQIFDSESPENVINTLPAQTLYTLVKDRGIESSLELLELIPINTFRTFLDFELWQKDTFNEDNLWNWLQLSDDEDPLKHTQRVLKSIDLKLLAMLVGKHVQVQVFDEKSETPPGVAWFTPDQGYTWLFVNLEDPDKHFHLNRLLALLYETSSDLFYQILSIPTVSTLTQLEEEAFIDRSKRLASEGVPEPEQYIEINTSLFPYQIKEELQAVSSTPKPTDIPVVEPVIAMASNGKLDPLDSALNESLDFEMLQGELTLIMNASLQFFNIPFYDVELLKLHAKKVKGAINIGLEKALSFEICSALDCINKLNLTKLYRLGLYELRAMQKPLKKINIDEIKAHQSDPASFSIIANLLEAFPAIPELFDKSGQITNNQAGVLDTTSRAIEHLEEINLISKFLSEQLKIPN